MLLLCCVNEGREEHSCTLENRRTRGNENNVSSVCLLLFSTQSGLNVKLISVISLATVLLGVVFSFVSALWRIGFRHRKSAHPVVACGDDPSCSCLEVAHCISLKNQTSLIMVLTPGFFSVAIFIVAPLSYCNACLQY